jgi:hypothetical protein
MELFFHLLSLQPLSVQPFLLQLLAFPIISLVKVVLLMFLSGRYWMPVKVSVTELQDF